MHRLINLQKSLQKRSFQINTEKVIVPKTENIKKGWDLYSKEYAQTIETFCLPLSMSLISSTGFDFANKVILECGCGSGAMSSIVAMSKPKDTKYLICDLSDEMIAIAKKRLYSSFVNKHLILNDLFMIQDIGYNENTLNEIFDQNNIKIFQQNCENLQDAKDNSVDIYFSSQVLHLVENPQKMLDESFRVLKSGGKACFSVFGNHEKSLYFYAFDSFLKQLSSNQDTKKKFRSKFYLGTDSGKSLLKNMLQKSGYKNILFLSQDIDYGVKHENEALAHFDMPANQASQKGLDKDTIDKGKEHVKEIYKKALKENNFIGIEGLVIIATKS